MTSSSNGAGHRVELTLYLKMFSHSLDWPSDGQGIRNFASRRSAPVGGAPTATAPHSHLQTLRQPEKHITGKIFRRAEKQGNRRSMHSATAQQNHLQVWRPITTIQRSPAIPAACDRGPGFAISGGGPEGLAGAEERSMERLRRLPISQLRVKWSVGASSCSRCSKTEVRINALLSGAVSASARNRRPSYSGIAGSGLGHGRKPRTKAYPTQSSLGDGLRVKRP
ncbi:MAG: hypothetical protein JWL62_1922 [Hyphomicrobiales bacterium]|nr:hypothetical protein [Hyphomicrobiales bacterium]